jgi:hypothetical protein
MRFSGSGALFVFLGAASLCQAQQISPGRDVRWPAQCTSSGGVYQPATNTCVAPGTAANPAGSNSQIQFNSGGVFGGAAGITTSNGNDLNVIGTVAVGPKNLPLTPRYPNATAGLVPNSTLAFVNNYGQAVTTGAANFGPTTGQTSRDWISFGHLYRLRQNGTITRVSINVPVTTGITGFYVSVCRTGSPSDSAPTNTDTVANSVNLAGSLVAGVNTLTVSLPALWGDYLCGRVEWSGGASVQNLYTPAANSATGETATTYFVDNAASGSTAANYNWAAQSSLASKIMLVQASMSASLLVSTGDSIPSGATLSYSFADSFAPTTLQYQAFPGLTALALGVTHQNIAQAGQRMSSGVIPAQCTAAAALAPKYMLMEGGVNDILGSVSLAAIQSGWNSCLSAATGASAVPIVTGILPFGDGSTTSLTQLALRDQVNAWLQGATIAAGGVYVNPDAYLGLYDSRGPAGNLWAMNCSYFFCSGNIHLTQIGAQRMAQAILDVLRGTVTFGSAPSPPVVNFTGGTADSPGIIRSLGVNVPTSGTGAETYYSSGKAVFSCYARPSGGPCPVDIGNAATGGSGIHFDPAQIATIYGNVVMNNGQFTTNALRAAVMIRSTGNSTTNAAGAGAEMYLSGSTGTFGCFDRTGGTACAAQLGSATLGINLNPTGNVIAVTGSSLTVAPNATFSGQVTHSGVTVMPNLRSNNTANTDLTGRFALVSGAGSYTLTQSYSHVPNCLCADATTPANACSVAESTTTLTFTGTGTDTIKYICVGQN